MKTYINIEGAEKTSYNYTINRLGIKTFEENNIKFLEFKDKTISRPINHFQLLCERLKNTFDIDFKKELELSKKEVIKLEPLSNTNTLDSQLKKLTGFGWSSLYWFNANGDNKEVSARKGNIIKCVKTNQLVELV